MVSGNEKNMYFVVVFLRERERERDRIVCIIKIDFSLSQGLIRVRQMLCQPLSNNPVLSLFPLKMKIESICMLHAATVME